MRWTSLVLAALLAGCPSFEGLPVQQTQPPEAPCSCCLEEPRPVDAVDNDTRISCWVGSDEVVLVTVAYRGYAADLVDLETQRIHLEKTQGPYTLDCYWIPAGRTGFD